MERITFYLRTTKTSGKIRLRFRLTEGREVQLFHKSSIEADLADLKKFDMDGSLKPRVSLYNEELRLAITREIDAMHEAYKQLKEECPEFDATDFEARIDMLLNPEKYNIVKTEEIETLLARFDRYIDGLKTYGTVSEGRAKIYKIVWDKLSRYLIIFKKSHYTPTNSRRKIYWHSESSLSTNINMSISIRRYMEACKRSPYRLSKRVLTLHRRNSGHCRLSSMSWRKMTRF